MRRIEVGLAVAVAVLVQTVAVLPSQATVVSAPALLGRLPVATDTAGTGFSVTAFGSATATVGATATPAAALSGTVRTASAVPLPGATVEFVDATGAVLAATTSDQAGTYRLRAPRTAGRLVLGSGGIDRRAARLPAVFRWSADLTPGSDQALDLTLPATHRVSVVATDPAGRPLASARVSAGVEQPASSAALWPGGPPATGTQSVAPVPAPTGADGRADLWAFAAPDVGVVVVEADSASSPGSVERTVLPALDVAADQMIAAVPARPGCTPRRAPDLGPGPVQLVADLDSAGVRRSPSRGALLEAADDIVSGAIPAVAYNFTLAGDSLRYLYDEGVALRRVAGILAYAYATTGRPVFLDAMATKVALNAARWPDWNPGHALDSAQVATAVALAYGWSGHRLSATERAVVSGALATRMVLSYSCADGMLAGTRARTGNQNSVIATAATLAGIATRNDATAWGAVAVSDGTGALARTRLDDGSGRSVAAGPTVEGFMYTTYEAANLALLHATRWRNTAGAAVTGALTGTVAELDRLAAWTERCGTVADPDMEDGWDYYPWIDRPTALAAMAAAPGAGAHVLEMLAELQARDTLTVPERGTWPAPDGIAELVVSGLAPASTAPPTVQSYASGSEGAGSHWGCATHEGMHAVLGAAPNDAAHGHRDLGNVVVRHGDQEVLADLGQRDYGLGGVSYAWRPLTKAHNTVGVLQPDGRVIQRGQGSGTVTALADGLQMVSTDSLDDVDWRRQVRLGATSVTVHDEIGLRPTGVAKTLSVSFLLATPPARVRDLGGGRLRFGLGDGSTWELTAPSGTVPTFRDAHPTAPYDDTADFRATLGPAHTLVTFTAPLIAMLDLTTSLNRVTAGT